MTTFSIFRELRAPSLIIIAVCEYWNITASEGCNNLVLSRNYLILPRI